MTVIENKQSDGKSISDKNKAWNELCDKFNLSLTYVKCEVRKPTKHMKELKSQNKIGQNV